MLSTESLLLLGALALDAFGGEWPNRVHPVAWLGSLTSRVLRLAPTSGRIRQLAFGAALALGVPALAVLVAHLALGAASALPYAAALLGLFLLKSTFALRALGHAGLELAKALERGGAEAARPYLRSLCSRDPSALDERALSAATVESLAENLSDSVIAPLFYYALFGLPGAIAYRAVNTLDAMVGYRGRFEYLGKASARLDDLSNLVPARLSAGLLLLAGLVLGHPVRRGLRAIARDARATESPNAGWPMAAAAGLLGVTLDKPGSYRLFAEGGDASPGTVRAAWRLVRLAGAFGSLLALAAIEVLHGR